MEEKQQALACRRTANDNVKKKQQKIIENEAVFLYNQSCANSREWAEIKA